MIANVPGSVPRRRRGDPRTRGRSATPRTSTSASRAARGDALLAANPDAVPEPGAVAALARVHGRASALRRRRPADGLPRRLAAAVAAALPDRRRHGRPPDAAAQGRPPARATSTSTSRTPDEPVQADWMLGGFLLLRRAMLDELGGLRRGLPPLRRGHRPRLPRDAGRLGALVRPGRRRPARAPGRDRQALAHAPHALALARASCASCASTRRGCARCRATSSSKYDRAAERLRRARLRRPGALRGAPRAADRRARAAARAGRRRCSTSAAATRSWRRRSPRYGLRYIGVDASERMSSRRRGAAQSRAPVRGRADGGLRAAGAGRRDALPALVLLPGRPRRLLPPRRRLHAKKFVFDFTPRLHRRRRVDATCGPAGLSSRRDPFLCRSPRPARAVATGLRMLEPLDAAAALCFAARALALRGGAATDPSEPAREVRSAGARLLRHDYGDPGRYSARRPRLRAGSGRRSGPARACSTSLRRREHGRAAARARLPLPRSRRQRGR